MTKGPPDIAPPGWSQANPEGRLADNIVGFGRLLRRAGLPIGPASVAEAVEAVLTAGLGSRDDFYWALHAVMVTRHDDTALFDQAFALFWRSREYLEKLLAQFSLEAWLAEKEQGQRPDGFRLSGAVPAGSTSDTMPASLAETAIQAQFAGSGHETLHTTDFSLMSAAETAMAKKAIQSMKIRQELLATRRRKPAATGNRIDRRATLRRAMAGSAEIILPRFTSPRRLPPPIVVLADISGSMKQFTNIFLHFIHSLGAGRSDVHAFLFGTRLTNITRQIRHRDIGAALDDCASLVVDWSGGTRIGEALATFNRDWSRRVLSQRTTVLIMTDGLERGEATELDIQLDRLHRSCRRLIWLNPLLRFDGFQPRAPGVTTIMAHVDELRPVHSLKNLQDLCTALETPPARGRATDPRQWLARHGQAA